MTMLENKKTYALSDTALGLARGAAQTIVEGKGRELDGRVKDLMRLEGELSSLKRKHRDALSAVKAGREAYAEAVKTLEELGGTAPPLRPALVLEMAPATQPPLFQLPPNPEPVPAIVPGEAPTHYRVNEWAWKKIGRAGGLIPGLNRMVMVATCKEKTQLTPCKICGVRINLGDWYIRAIPIGPRGTEYGSDCYCTREACLAVLEVKLEFSRQIFLGLEQAKSPKKEIIEVLLAKSKPVGFSYLIAMLPEFERKYIKNHLHILVTKGLVRRDESGYYSIEPDVPIYKPVEVAR